MIADGIIRRVVRFEQGARAVELLRALDGRDHPWVVVAFERGVRAAAVGVRPIWRAGAHSHFAFEEPARALYEARVRAIGADFVDGIAPRDDGFTLADVRAMRDRLVAHNVPPAVCPACGRAFFILFANGAQLDDSDRVRCDCGARMFP